MGTAGTASEPDVARKPRRSQRNLMPRQPRGMGLGLVLALLAHALLILALAFGVNWRSSEPQGVEAELWSSVPRAAAPRDATPNPQPVETKPTPPLATRPEPKPEPVIPPKLQPPPVPTPKPTPTPTPAPTPAPDPQIAIDKARRDDAKRREALQDQQRADALREKQRAEQERAKAEAAQKEKDRADAERLAAAREANLKRMMGQAGATGAATDTGTAPRSSGPSASYAGRIRALFKRNIVFNDSVSTNPVAVVEVRAAPDGTILGKRLVTSSGIPAWDDAVLRAVDKAEVLPRDIDGRVPSPMVLEFKPNE